MNSECSMTFETVDLNVDLQNNLVYIGEVFGPYEADMNAAIYFTLS